MDKFIFLNLYFLGSNSSICFTRRFTSISRAEIVPPASFSRCKKSSMILDDGSFVLILAHYFSRSRLTVCVSGICPFHRTGNKHVCQCNRRTAPHLRNEGKCPLHALLARLRLVRLPHHAWAHLINLRLNWNRVLSAISILRDGGEIDARLPFYPWPCYLEKYRYESKTLRNRVSVSWNKNTKPKKFTPVIPPRFETFTFPLKKLVVILNSFSVCPDNTTLL